MKNMILRINDLNAEEAGVGTLTHVSMNFFEGESAALIGLNYSGKDLLTGILDGSENPDIKSGSIYVCDKKIRHLSELKDSVYRMSPGNYEIRNWSVVEYALMDQMTWVITGARTKRLKRQLEQYFSEFHLDIDPEMQFDRLGETEKRIVDLIRAKIKKKKILIIEDEFEGMNQEAIRKFGEILKEELQNGMTAVVSSHSEIVSEALSDNYLIFKGGQLVKICPTGQVGRRGLDRFYRREKVRDSQKMEERVERTEIFSADVQMKNGSYRMFRFHDHEITSALSQDRDVRRGLFQVLSGRRIDPNTYYYLYGEAIFPAHFYDFVDNRIISIEKIGSEGGDSIFNKMSVEDNYLLPSLSKISGPEYALSGRNLIRLAPQKKEASRIRGDQRSDQLSLNERIVLLFERWLLYRPKVLILLEPFANCDREGVDLIQEYLKKMAEAGTSVIIIKSRHEYVADLSDVIIDLNKNMKK